MAAVRDAGAKAIKVQGDLTVPANVTALFDAAVDAFGGVDFAVNTVGKVLRKPMLETTEDEYDSMFDINAKSAYFFLQQAGKRLNDNGSVVTIVTALEHFTRAAAREFGTRADGHPVLLSAGNPGARRVPQVAGDANGGYTTR